MAPREAYASSELGDEAAYKSEKLRAAELVAGQLKDRETITRAHAKALHDSAEGSPIISIQQVLQNAWLLSATKRLAAAFRTENYRAWHAALLGATNERNAGGHCYQRQESPAALPGSGGRSLPNSLKVCHSLARTAPCEFRPTIYD